MDVKPLGVQVNMRGYGGKECTLLGVYEPVTGQFVAHKITPYTVDRIAQCFVVGTSYRQDCDCVFVPALMGEAIKAYDDMRHLLEFSKNAMRCDPDSVIQVVSYEESGVKREISENLSNEKAATLAACWALSKQTATKSALSAFDYLEEGGVFGGSYGPIGPITI